MPRFFTAQMAELNDALKPRLRAVYDESAAAFSERGQQVVDRALQKGTVGGDIGMQALFEPAMLLSLVAERDVMFELASEAKSIPFIGDYGRWAPCEAVIAAAYRVLAMNSDPRAAEVELWLSLPENGGEPGPPVVHQAMANRLNGLLAEQIRSDAYAPPLKLPQFSYVIAKLRELSVMWAFGGSAAWPRERIDEAIATVQEQVADFVDAL